MRSGLQAYRFILFYVILAYPEKSAFEADKVLAFAVELF